jgi:hypothetical protein
MDVGVYQRDPVQQTTGPSRQPGAKVTILL